MNELVVANFLGIILNNVPNIGFYRDSGILPKKLGKVDSLVPK